MQPHAPYLAELFTDVNDRRTHWRGQLWTNHDLSAQEVHQAYMANLELVLTSAEELLDEVSGRAIVTADHGERQWPIPVGGVIDHPAEMYIPQLADVPWLEIDNGDRRNVRSDPPISMQVDNETRQQRPEALGYA